ncbi:MAG: hypothetical protein ABMB14_33275 [Myxococcota bacterium]
MVVIGAGRIGAALALRAAARDVPITLVGRDGIAAGLAGPEGDPVLVAVRTDDLRALADTIPAHRRSDLVFVQNGAIRDLLSELALSQATRGVLYVMAARRGDDLAPGGRSLFTGVHALAVVRWLGALDVPAEAVDRARFSVYELEKLLWLAIHGVLCELHQAPVGVVAAEHRDEIAALVVELGRIGQAAWGVDVEPGWMVERLVAYSRSIPDYRASVKEWPWRNGWLVDRSIDYGIPTPIHDRLLAQLGHR